jgi:hypothetical protein
MHPADEEEPHEINQKGDIAASSTHPADEEEPHEINQKGDISASSMHPACIQHAPSPGNFVGLGSVLLIPP